jgi:hypothetical protein
MKKVTDKLLTDRLRQYEVAVLAVYLLGGATRSIDTEDAAVKCHELAARLFSWQKHKEQINLELVRVSLSDAKKTKNGGLLSGSGREGWRLSSRGLDWIRAREQAGSHFATREGKHGSAKAGSIDSVRRERERQRVLASQAWQEWKETGVVSARAAQQIFRIDEYTTERMAAIKVARLRSTFEVHDELSHFLSIASHRVLKGAEK